MKNLCKLLKSTLHQSWCVVYLAVGVILGVILGIVFRVNYLASGYFLILALMLFVIAMVRPKVVWMVLALVAGLLMSFVRIANELTGENYIRQFYGETVVVYGVITGDPNTDEGGTSYKLSQLKFGENGEFETAGNLYVSGYRNYDLMRGDTVKLEGKMSEGFGTYAGYMWRPEIKLHLRPEPGDAILGVRNFFATRIKTQISTPQSDLGLSYLLGMKAGLPDELNEQLRVVGLTHIVVASGAHLSILVEIARKIFGKISRMTGVIFSVLFVVFFMSMVGWTPSIMRAGIMAILTLLAGMTGRKIEPWRIILIVAAGTLLMNPMFVIDLGWLLSFASFGGIMIVGPRLTKYFYGDKKPNFVAETIITTIAATIMTLPITLYYYGQISLISVVANLLILPTLSCAMGLVFMVGVVAEIPIVGMAIGWCATKILDYHIAVIGFFGKMDNFLIKMEPYQPWVFGIYVAIGGILAIGMIRKRRNVIIGSELIARVSTKSVKNDKIKRS